jgi:hypothetical protein
MRGLTSDRIDDWTRGVGIVALALLVWAAIVPGGVFWALLVAGVIGSAAVTAVLVRRRRTLSIAEVIASATREPPVRGSQGGAGLRPRGEPRP